MPNIEQIVNVQIAVDSTSPTQKGFGIPLICTYHTRWLDRIREYSDLSELEDDDFETYDPTYRMAQALLLQNPRVTKFKVGRLTTAQTPTKKITVTTATEGEVISCTVVGPNGAETAISRTVPGSSSTTAEATAVAALIDAITDVAATSAAAVVTCTAAAGSMFYITNLKNLTFEDTTADGNIDADLSLIEAEDDDFFGIAIASAGATDIADVAAWTETRERFFMARLRNYKELDSSTDVTGPALSAAEYDYTAGIYTGDDIHYADCAWLGKQLPKDPGSSNYAHKELKGVTADKLTSSQRANLVANNMNFYETISGLSITRWGTVASGDYIDNNIGILWLKARIREEVFGLLASLEKVPYTDAWIGMVVAAVRKVLNLGVQRLILSPDSPIVVRAPKASEVSRADKTARLLPDVKFSAVLGDGINKVNVNGTVSVSAT